MSEYSTLVVIGAGNMGAAVVAAAVQVRPGTVVHVADPDGAKLEQLGRGRDVVTHASGGEAIRAAGVGAIVVLAVKPQVFGAVTGELVSAGVVRGQLFVSIMAGVRTGMVHERLGGGAARVTRAMPNLAIVQREGMTCICAGPGATAGDVAFTESLFAGAGKVVRVDENLFDAFTAVASSGLAYVYAFAQAMIEGAVGVGFDRATAVAAVKQTFSGAASLMSASDQEPGALVAGVKSKGGTTEAALRVLERRGVGLAIGEAVVAARDRGRELGK